jgi:N-acetylgalactosamine kinase
MERFAARFVEEFGGDGAPLFCRAPGRVNIIGEHTDYNGLSVLPMAIDKDIRIAFRARGDAVVRMRNANAAFAHAEFEALSPIAPSPTGSWDNYCKAAVEGLNRHFGIPAGRGMDMLIGGSIPISAGLSSSSALVVACALAYLKVIGKELEKDITRLALAGLLADAEHYVGTRGGGMDHAIILLGDSAHACKIDFFPLRVERATLPSGHAFVVCNSMVKAEKTGDALHLYNAGPRLCQLITALVGDRVRREFGDEVMIARLGDLWNGHLCLTHGEVAELFEATLPEERTTLAAAAARLGMTAAQVREKWLGDLKEPAEGYRLKARARHQMTEYRRVELARDALLGDEASELGALMNASHRSCADDYEVSCPELEALTTIARNAGAIGSRLTGAGFGGCTVSLVREEAVEAFREKVAREYYAEYLGGRGVSSAGEAVFVARAGDGAGYL